jgi:hypothetical protein
MAKTYRVDLAPKGQTVVDVRVTFVSLWPVASTASSLPSDMRPAQEEYQLPVKL